VLLVDDDRDTLGVLSMLLAEQQAIVQTAGSAAEALAIFQWYRPDVLLADLALPEEDGFALIQKVRAHELGAGGHTAAVALTAYVRVEDRARALSAGYNMFVPKPVEPQELIAVVAHLADPGSSIPLV
jgi:CheY-like chemotaxis protein